mmetsp:Transcript_24643/g.56894  ORF Transcript_24643/g.56894 Transcript_24643/m.56894 type:complete len:690 (-) Transcript_24643:62-2131(-)
MGEVGSKQDLDDKYHIQKVKLGEGSFGIVWRAVDRQSKEVVAIKQMDKALLTKRNIRRSDVEREITMMRACEHINITQLIDTFDDERYISLALEYCEGGDFGDKVKECVSSLSESEAADWMWQVISAIAALHSKRICHRDIKPENFMVAGGDTLKLSDFGLAVVVAKGQLIQEKCGTPAYMAPEVYKLSSGGKGYTFPVDLWAAGLILCMLMNGGRHPFVQGQVGSERLDDARLMKGMIDYSNLRGFAASGGLSMLQAKSVPDGAINLCKRLANALPGERATAVGALQDAWLEPSRRRLASRVRGTPTRQPAGLLKIVLDMFPMCGQCNAEVLNYARKNDTVHANPVFNGSTQKGQTNSMQKEPSQKGYPAAQTQGLEESHLAGAAATTGRSLGEGPTSPGPSTGFTTNFSGGKQGTSVQATHEPRPMPGTGLFESFMGNFAAGASTKNFATEYSSPMGKQGSSSASLQATHEPRPPARSLGMFDSFVGAFSATNSATVAPPPAPTGTASESFFLPSSAGGDTMRSSGSLPKFQSTGLQRVMETFTIGHSEASQPPPAVPSQAAQVGLLPAGTKCCYVSPSYGSQLAMVEGFNEEDCTYNLNVRPHAGMSSIMPDPHVPTRDSWPPGTLVTYLYNSATQKTMPGVIQSFNEGKNGAEGTYNLDVRLNASADRIRPRTILEAERLQNPRA